MPYAVEIKESAAKALATLPKKHQRQVAARIDALAREPRPAGSEKLAGLDSLYRVRSGDYRIVYQIYDEPLIVLVLTIGHRREVYRRT